MMDTDHTILVVEDGQAEREALARMLRLEQFAVVTAPNPQQALEYVDEPIGLIISDLRMGKNSGIDLLRIWQEQKPGTPFIMVTAYGDVDSAVTAMKLGAADYLTKPVNPLELLRRVRQCLESRHQPASDGGSDSALEGIVGRSALMREVCEQTRLAARTESTVLILGESGTGKELIAEAIHRHSPRSGGPFVLVNMAAIPDTLVESELFGHVRGAFTGAATDRMGRFEAAAGGTIFIDEIGDFPASSQAKLLRVLENRVITPVGSNDDRQVDVRMVAATSRDLRQMAADGAFREDLYYRLNVVVIQLPALRDRREDISLLAEHFLTELCLASNKPPLRMDPELLETLTSLSWPGNVRQLRNCLESMVVMARHDVLTVADLPRTLFGETEEPAAPPAPMAFDRTLDDLKRAAILRALKQHGGNRTRAAESLGISVRTLQRRLKQWGDDDASLE